jgi:hypothetical protein
MTIEDETEHSAESPAAISLNSVRTIVSNRETSRSNVEGTSSHTLSPDLGVVRGESSRCAPVRNICHSLITRCFRSSRISTSIRRSRDF